MPNALTGRGAFLAYGAAVGAVLGVLVMRSEAARVEEESRTCASGKADLAGEVRECRRASVELQKRADDLSSTLQATRRGQVTTEPFCAINRDLIAFQTVVESTFTKPANHPRERILMSAACEPSTKKCQGAFVGIDDIEQGKPVRLFGVDSLGPEVSLISAANGVAILQSGPLTVTLDIASAEVRTAVSGEHKFTKEAIEGRGIGPCPSKEP